MSAWREKVEENKVRVCCSAKKILVCQGSRRRKLVGDLMFSTGYIFRERGVEARLLTSGAKNLTRNRRRRLLSTDPRRDRGENFFIGSFSPAAAVSWPAAISWYAPVHNPR